MAKLKSGAATEEPSIAEKEEDVEPVKAVETISEKEEIVVEEVKAEEIYSSRNSRGKRGLRLKLNHVLKLKKRDFR